MDDLKKKSAFQKLVEKDQKAKNKPDAWEALRAERAEKVRLTCLAIIDALVRRGGRSAPEPLRLDVKADSYTQKLALDHLVQQGAVERASDGSWRGGDWRLTDRARAQLIRDGREIPPELTPQQRRAAVVAERVLDGLRGEGIGTPPVLSLRFLRAHVGISWQLLQDVLDALERERKVVRVWEGARLCGYRLAIADNRESVTEAAQAAAPALAVVSEDPRAQARLRVRAELLGVLARHRGAVPQAEIRKAIRVGPVLLRELLKELASEGIAEQVWHGASPVGWKITDAGREREKAIPDPAAPALLPRVFVTAREMFGPMVPAPAPTPAPAPPADERATSFLRTLAEPKPAPARKLSPFEALLARSGPVAPPAPPSATCYRCGEAHKASECPYST